MRTIHLNCARSEGFVVQSNVAANPVTSLAAVQNDVLEIVVHDYERNGAMPPIPFYQENPLLFTTMRASIVTAVNAPPSGGTFKLHVGDQTTPPLTWPGDANAFANWKATVLAALKALPNVGDDGVVAADPPNTPAHIFYFTWTDIARTDPITVVENRLSPPIDASSEGSLADAGYTQQIRLIQFPVVTTAEFTRPLPPPATVVETRAGAIGVNEEQTLEVPALASGSLSLTWNGAATRTMDVTGLTAVQLQTALNAIVLNGDTNPSFSVEKRTTNDGQRFSIQFVGPLAGAPQPQLLVSMHDQIPWPYATGKLDLRGRVGIDAAINGGKSANLVFELVIDEDEHYLLPITIAASATGPQTMSDLEANGGIVTVTQTVYVTQDMGEPFIQAAPGVSFTPTGPGSVLIITHGLETWRPRVTATFYEVDHAIFSANPNDLEAATIGSHEVDRASFTEHATTENQVVITLATALVDDPQSPFDYRLLKIDIASPDATLMVWSQKLLWDNCVDATPNGESVRDKFAALDAALGVFGGTLKINASNIVGLIGPSQIDLSTLATSLVSQPSFATVLNTLLATNPSLVTSIATQLGAAGTDPNNAFIAALQATLTNSANTSLINTIGTQLTTQSATFASAVQTLVTTILQGGVNLPGNATPMLVPDVLFQIPAPQSTPAPSKAINVPVETTQTTGSGSNTISETTTAQTVVLTPQSKPIYAALSPAIAGAEDGGSLSGLLPSTSEKGKVYTVAGSAWSRSARGRRGRNFSDGATIANSGGYWYEVVQINGIWFAAECEREFACVALDDELLFPGTQFAFSATPSVVLKSDSGVRGRLRLIFEIGAFDMAAGDDLDSVAWSQIGAQTVWLSPVTVFRRFVITVAHASDGTLTGGISLAGRSATPFPVPSANFALRGRLSQFDTEEQDDPRGCLTFNMTGALASVVLTP